MKVFLYISWKILGSYGPPGPLGPSFGYVPAKFGARFNRQLSSIPHVCVRSLHVASPLRFFKTQFKKFACLFVTEEMLYNIKPWQTMAQCYTRLCQQWG